MLGTLSWTYGAAWQQPEADAVALSLRRGRDDAQVPLHDGRPVGDAVRFQIVPEGQRRVGVPLAAVHVRTASNH